MKPDERDAERLDQFLDGRGGLPVDAEVALMVQQLRRVSAGGWDRVAPPPRRRPLRRDLPIAAAAVLVAVALLLGISSTLGHGGTAGPPHPWRLTALLDQSTWRSGSTNLASETVTCATPRQCYATDAASGVVELSTTGIRGWTAAPLPPSSSITTGLACPTPLDCWAGGLAPSSALSGVPALQDQANEGVTATAGAPGDPALPAAGAGDDAVPVDGTEMPIMLGTVDGGGHWSEESLPSDLSQVVDVDCAAPATCVAVADLSSGAGSQVLLLTPTSNGWLLAGPPVTGFVPVVHQGISCHALRCVMVGEESIGDPATAAAVTSSDGGAVWSSPGALPGLALVEAVDCPTARRCLALGQGPAGPGGIQAYGPGVVLTSTHGGSSWSTAAASGLPPADLYTLSCIGRRSCTIGGALLGTPVSTGYGLLATTTDFAASFTEVSLPGNAGPAGGDLPLDFDAVLSVSCPARSCVALAALGAGSSGTSPPQAVLAGS